MRAFACKLVALFGLLLSVATAPAQVEAPELPMSKRLEEYGKLQEQLLPLFEKKEYDKAADACRKQMGLVPEASEPHYNLACALARLGQKEGALLELRVALEHGFDDTAHIREDEDLASLHDEPAFKKLLKTARDKELNAPHETADEIPGIKTIENFPEGGLRYRLRIDPKADAKKPARLLVWFHPSGGSMDDVVEEMSPRFAKDGFALLVFTQKNNEEWTDQDVAALERTLADVAKIEGVDAKKPVLLGFSAGGQLALQLWQEKPADFGGMVLDAAYPLDGQLFAQGKIQPMALPKGNAIKSCPIFALVGGDDVGGSELWKHVDKTWREAGVPLIVHIVPDKGHAWLLNRSETASLHDWLKRVAAGERPTAEPSSMPAPPGEEDDQPIKV